MREQLDYEVLKVPKLSIVRDDGGHLAAFHIELRIGPGSHATGIDELWAYAELGHDGIPIGIWCMSNDWKTIYDDAGNLVAFFVRYNEGKVAYSLLPDHGATWVFELNDQGDIVGVTINDVDDRKALKEILDEWAK